MGAAHGIYPWVSALVRRSLDEEAFWVVCGFFPLGGGGGEEDSPGQVLQSRFRRRRVGSNSPIFYVIYYILSSGGFTEACVRPSRTTPDPRCPGQHVMFKLGPVDDPLPHTDSEGSVAPRSDTDSTEQWVWCIMHMRLCYMLFLLYV